MSDYVHRAPRKRQITDDEAFAAFEALKASGALDRHTLVRPGRPDPVQALAYLDAISDAAETIATATSGRDAAIRRAARFGLSIDEIAAAARVTAPEAEAIRDALPGFNPDRT